MKLIRSLRNVFVNSIGEGLRVKMIVKYMSVKTRAADSVFIPVIDVCAFRRVPDLLKDINDSAYQSASPK